MSDDRYQRAFEQPLLLDVNEVAGLARMSPRTVSRLVDRGAMPPPVRLGSLARWPRAAIESWIAQGCPAVNGEEVSHVR